jgi:prepilin-type processing-associated H-X9-DG protein
VKFTSVLREDDSFARAAQRNHARKTARHHVCFGKDLAAEPDMKRRLSTQRTGGLTFLEVLVSIVVVGVAAAVFIPMLQPRRRGCGGINCVSNLKQVGLAMRMWSNDHNEKFPWNVSTNEGGTMELVGTSKVFQHFLAASNELSSPKVLSCPKDAQRTRATAWDQLTNDAWHISYFVGLEADETKPRSILSGDRNLTTNGRPAFGKVTIAGAKAMGWTARIHKNAGNIGFGDGSAMQFSAKDLQAPFQSARTNFGVNSIRLVIP